MTQVLDYRPDQGSAFVDLLLRCDSALADLESTELLVREPRNLFASIRRAPRVDTRIQAAAPRAEARRRTARRRLRGEPADPVLDTARGPLPQPLGHDHGAARGRSGCHGGATLYRASPRQRGAHEMHGRAAASRAPGDDHRTRPDRGDRGDRRLRTRLRRPGIADAPARRPRARGPAAADFAPAILGGATALAILTDLRCRRCCS